MEVGLRIEWYGRLGDFVYEAERVGSLGRARNGQKIPGPKKSVRGRVQVARWKPSPLGQFGCARSHAMQLCGKKP